MHNKKCLHKRIVSCRLLTLSDQAKHQQIHGSDAAASAPGQAVVPVGSRRPDIHAVEGDVVKGNQIRGGCELWGAVK